LTAGGNERGRTGSNPVAVGNHRAVKKTHARPRKESGIHANKPSMVRERLKRLDLHPSEFSLLSSRPGMR
jgi:hypothetical protein